MYTLTEAQSCYGHHNGGKLFSPDPARTTQTRPRSHPEPGQDYLRPFHLSHPRPTATERKRRKEVILNQDWRLWEANTHTRSGLRKGSVLIGRNWRPCCMVMMETNTQVKWPSKLKIGAKSKKDPHVKVEGKRGNVLVAKNNFWRQS
ncbi:hypothetical protein J4Q44_G00314090 [Coregonus suidteri]|uniref:BICC1 first type I KH domain-containing protein n=1 Tax=Coregonus suidteri TaxID=861788 RepID=A0AAN8QB96_9TELE